MSEHSELGPVSDLLTTFAQALDVRDSFGVEIVGRPTLASPYPVSALATASAGVVGVAASALIADLGHPPPGVTVHRELADAWFSAALAPVGWTIPPAWDAIAGDYRAGDGWIRLHTNAPHHRAVALAALGLDPDADRVAVAAAVSDWRADDLETTVVAGGGVAAVLRSPEAWAAHPQGAAVGAEPLIARDGGNSADGTSADGTSADGTSADGVPSAWEPRADRPLAGLRVLDLTRVLAGPVATRLLAGFGATVLRIDPPDWDEPAIVPEISLGKRLARLNARDPDGFATLSRLLAQADVVVHGYRPGALERLGLGADARRRLRPGLVDVSLDAYGHTGPWAGRRGFDSLVQMSSGIAHTGMTAADADRPVPMPVQALDHATGHLAAAAVLAGLTERVRTGNGSQRRLSLARTAVELERVRAASGAEDATPADDLPSTPIDTAWGPARLLSPPLDVYGAPLRWELGPRPLGSDAPRF